MNNPNSISIIGLCLGLGLLTACPGGGSEDASGGSTTEATTTGMGTTTMGPGTGPDDVGTMVVDDTTTTTGPDDTTAGPTGPDDTTGGSTGPDDTTGGSTGMESSGGESTTGVPGVSFEADVYPIILANCGCHVGGISGGLAMPDAETAYNNLVDVPSANLTNAQDRVEPGDPDASFLWHKLNGTLAMGEGSQMPLLAMPLGAANLMTIEQWILDGALP